MSRLVSISLVLVALAGAAHAESVELDRFLEAHGSGDWSAAEKAWHALEAAMEPRDTSVLLKHVDVQLGLGERAAARATLEHVLEGAPRNVLALATLARLRAGESREAAKELLLDAAREGYPVLRDVRDAKELGALRDDPAFVLAAMRAFRAYAPGSEKWRDPFAVPRLSSAEPARVPRVVKPTAREARKRLADHLEQGETLVRSMRKDLRDERLAAVSDALLDVKALCDEMRKESEPDFALGADELWRRAARLDAEARKLLRVKELGITVTGIVIAPRAPSRTIVTLAAERTGRIYDEGDELRDRNGDRIPGLRVARISEGSVRFSYDGTDFARELRSKP